MCTRYVLLEEHYRAVLQRLGIATPALFVSRYNVSPGAAVPVIRIQPGAEQREVVPLDWGWPPPWARSKADKQVNVRAETLARKGPLRETVARGRCVLPASGFFEWRKIGSARQPYLYQRRDGQPFGLAALWQPVSTTEPGSRPACAVITTGANAVVQPVHDRMPAMLALDECEAWLDPSVNDPARVLALIRPLADSDLQATAVHPRMNNVRYEAPDVIVPIPEDAVGRATESPAPERRAAKAAVDDGQFTLGI